MYRNYVNNIKYRIFKEMIIFFRKKIRHESKISDQRKEREFKISLDFRLPLACLVSVFLNSGDEFKISGESLFVGSVPVYDLATYAQRPKPMRIINSVGLWPKGNMTERSSFNFQGIFRFS